MATKLMQKNIPKGWEAHKLVDVCAVEWGNTDLTKSAYVPKGKYLAVSATGPDGRIDHAEHKKGTPVLSAIGANCGRMFSPDEDFTAIKNTITFDAIRGKSDPKFLFYLLSNIDVPKRGGAQPFISKGDLQNLNIVLPQKQSEQEKIAEILSAVDGEIQKTEDIISAVEKLKKGLMQQLFTHGIGHTKFKKTAIGEVPVEWLVMKLGEVATITRGGSPRPIESFITTDNNALNWLKIGDIESGAKYIEHTTQKIKRSGLSKTTLVHVGDFILSNSMSFGRPYIMKIDACIHDGWLAFKDIRNNLISSDFLYYLLSSKSIQDNFLAIAAGSGVKNLKKESVANVNVALPSVHEQQKISEILSAVGEKISINQELREKLKFLKKGLMQDLLTGKKRTV